MINLSDITLFTMSWGDKLNKTQKAIERCLSLCKFHDVVFLEPKMSNVKQEDEIRYNEFMIKELHQYIKSEFCLVIQWDGFIVDADMWTNEFLEYDYIGAAWQYPNCKNPIGNGGFSLRSRKFLEVCKTFDYNPFNCEGYMIQQQNFREIAPEDWYLCYNNYESLSSQDIKFPKISLANRFSVEHIGCHTRFNRERIGTYNCFGFHDPRNTAAMDLIKE